MFRHDIRVLLPVGKVTDFFEVPSLWRTLWLAVAFSRSMKP